MRGWKVIMGWITGGRMAGGAGSSSIVRRVAPFLVLWAVLGPVLAAGQERRIGTIAVRSLDVFAPEESERFFLFMMANGLHVPTRESVIRRYLLFKEGDVYDRALLEETERNLRALPFLQSASITAKPGPDGRMEVEVVTQDSWSLQLDVSMGRDGGTTRRGLSLTEGNLLGSGREISLGWSQDGLRTMRWAALRDPLLLGAYGEGRLMYASTSDGRQLAIALRRPFYSFRTPQAYEAFYSETAFREALYDDAMLSARYRVSSRRIGFAYGLAVTRHGTHARRVTIGFEAQEDSFFALPERPADPLPEDRRFRYVFLQYQDVTGDFVKWNYVDFDRRFEDFNLGRRLGARLAVSPSVLGLDRTTYFGRLALERGFRLGSAGFLLVGVSGESRFDGGPKNTLLRAEVRLIRRFKTQQPQTLVSRLAFVHGSNVDRDVRFYADGESGLRGYRDFAFWGDKRIVWNLEDRISFGQELFQLFVPGVAIFVDAGTAAPPGRPLSLAESRVDAGVGLRIGIPRFSAHSILRVDAAYALRPDPRGRRGWLISFSSGQAF